jgi:hypothetical protein
VTVAAADDGLSCGGLGWTGWFAVKVASVCWR